MIEKMVINMALKSMKDNFLSLSDEEKQKEFCKLLDENQELKEKLDKFENPEDMTLMMMWCTEKVKDENKKLKQQLHEASLTIQEMAEQDIECPSNCEKLRQLKKLNEEKTKIGVANHKYASQCEDKVIIMEAQQKEFIKYLEDLIKQNEIVVKVSKYGLSKNCSKLLIDFYKEILQKCKEIIGVSDENNIK